MNSKRKFWILFGAFLGGWSGASAFNALVSALATNEAVYWGSFFGFLIAAFIGLLCGVANISEDKP